jgi:hypothetical protein
MLAISITDNAVTVLSLKRRIFGGYVVVGLIRQPLPTGIVKDGVLANPDRFIEAIGSCFSAMEPAVSRNDLIVLSLPDILMEHRVLTVPSTGGDEVLMRTVLTAASAAGVSDIGDAENYFQVISKTKDSAVIEYASMQRNLFIPYLAAFSRLGYAVTFLTATSYAQYGIFHSRLGSGILLTAHIENETVTWTGYGQSGVIRVGVGKANDLNTLVRDTKETLALDGKQVSHLVLSYEPDEGGDKKLPEGEKLSDLLAKYLKEKGIHINAEGLPSFDVATVLGLVTDVGKKWGVNFLASIPTQDLKSMMNPGPVTQPSLSGVSTPQSSPVAVLSTPSVSPVPIESSPSTEIKKPEENVTMRGSVPSVIVEHEGNSIKLPSPRIMIILGIIILVLVVGGLSLTILGKGQSGLNLPFTKPSPTPTVTPSPTVTPTPTVDPALKRSAVKVEVQNGTQKTGYAREVADTLEKKGYKGISKGNADRDDYEQSVIRVKPGKESYAQLLREDVKGTVDPGNPESLSSDSDVDILLILGNK